MNLWKALLESLHSAFMDEIRGRLGEQTLELGMPAPFAGWGLPDAALAEGHISSVTLDGQRGWVWLAAAPDAVRWAKAAPGDYWEGMMLRARTEFDRRGISPEFGKAQAWRAADGFPSGPAPARLIWMPVRVQGRAIAIAVGR